MSGEKNIVLVPLMRLDGKRDLPPPCAKRGKLFINSLMISFVLMVWAY